MSDAPVTLSPEVRALVHKCGTRLLPYGAPPSHAAAFRNELLTLAAAIVAETQRACLPTMTTQEPLANLIPSDVFANLKGDPR